MIKVKTLQNFGLTQPTDGYVIYLNRAPVIQLHYYPDYFSNFYTVFWRANPNLQGLIDSFRDIVNELAEAFNCSRDDLNIVNAEYTTKREIRKHSFTFYPAAYKSKETLKHQRYIDDRYPAIKFARFKVDFKYPILLWADLENSPTSEIGFSTIEYLPASVVKLFAVTRPDTLHGRTLHELRQTLFALVPQVPRMIL